MASQIGEWKVGKYLGRGGFADVYLGTHETTGDQAALKIIKPPKDGRRINGKERKKVEKEIGVMKKIDHPNVVQLKDFIADGVFKGKKSMVIVLEYASGGELFDYLSLTGAFEESVSRTYFHQLIEGMAAVHESGQCHRDLKPENILLDGNFQLKIADFGMAHSISTLMKTECGTRGYMAPEVIGNKMGYSGQLTDVWACGVILFIMTSGFPPYNKPDPRNDWWFNKLYHKKMALFWKAHCRLEYFSEDFKDLYNKMNTVDPKNRISMAGIMQHPWYKGAILSSSALERTMARRKKKLDDENQKLKIKKQKEQDLRGFQSDTVKDLGEEDFDAESDTLPTESPPSIILALDLLDIKNDEDEGDDDSVRESIDMSIPSSVESKEKAPVYSPTRVVLTKIDCQASPSDVLDGLKSALKTISGCNSTIEGYKVIADADTLGGKVHFAVSIYTHPEDSNRSIVEFQKEEGGSGAFRNLYAELRNQLDQYAYKKPVIADDQEDLDGVDWVDD